MWVTQPRAKWQHLSFVYTLGIHNIYVCVQRSSPVEGNRPLLRSFDRSGGSRVTGSRRHRYGKRAEEEEEEEEAGAAAAAAAAPN